MRRLAWQRLVIASHNAGKVREIGALLAPLGVTVLSAGELGLPVPEETEASFAGNAGLKARAAAAASGHPALSDDSGLEVDALGGAPGVWSADWAETAGGRDFDMAMARVHAALAGRDPPWTARFRCALCLAFPDGEEAIFEGAVEGDVVWPPRGGAGFGYDPMFRPAGERETFGEMPPERKHAISHRAAAFAALLKALS